MAPKTTEDQPSIPHNKIKTVAIVGASGQLGKHITAALLKTGQHDLTAITRSGSESTFPEAVKVAKVDYDSHSSLVDAMRGHDALVITMVATAPAGSVARLVEAAIEAGIPWILPNEWGSDYTDLEVNKDTMLGADKLEIRRLIGSKGGNTAWIAVACGFWYDYSLASGETSFGFDLPKKEAIFYDDGKFAMNVSTLPYCGQAVANLLSLPVSTREQKDGGSSLESFRNQIVRVRCFQVDQQEMLASVLRVTGDNETDWNVKHATSKDRYNEGKQRLQGGERMGFRLMLYARAFYPSNKTNAAEDYSDEALGLQPPTLDDVTREVVDRVKV